MRRAPALALLCLVLCVFLICLPGVVVAGAVAVVADNVLGGGSDQAITTLGATRQAGVVPTSLGPMIEVPATPLPGTPPGGYPTGTYAWGQCTYWAAFNHRVTWKADAYRWKAAASEKGATISSVPVIGSIAVYARGNGYDTAFGHVAIVVAFDGTTYTVSEMNMLRAGSGAVDERTVAWPDAHVEGFIE